MPHLGHGHPQPLRRGVPPPFQPVDPAGGGRAAGSGPELAQRPDGHYLGAVNYLPLLALLLSPALAAKRKPAAPPPPPPVVFTPAPLSAAEQTLVDDVMAHHPPPADYVFLLDTSGDMLEKAMAAREAIANLVEQLPDGDRVEIVAFHTRPKVAVELTVVDGTTRKPLSDQIRAVALTSAKDSDLGAGLAWAVSDLNRKDGGAVQFVFMMSTFCHNPSVNSEYGQGGNGCRAVRGLSKIAETLRSGRSGRTLVTTYFTTATKDVKANAEGLAAAQEVLGEGTTVDLATTSFTTWTSGYRARLERVLPLARADAAAATFSARVLRQPTPQLPNVSVELSSGTTWLGLTVDNLTVSGGTGGGTPGSVDLQPIYTVDVPVQLPPNPFAILPHDDVVSIPLTFGGDGTLQPDASLRGVGIDPARPGLTATVNATWHRTYGLPGWLVAMIAAEILAVAIGVGIFLRRRLRKVRLGGSFSYRRIGGPRQPLDIADLEQAYIVIRPDGELGVGARKDAVLALRMVRHGMNASAEVEVFADGVEINRKLARPGRHRVVVGATSFLFGEYRMAWE